MSGRGQKHRFDPLPTTSGLPPLATQLRTCRFGSFVPIGELSAAIAGPILHRGTGADRHERSSDQR
jgi:hypothetical protein